MLPKYDNIDKDTTNVEIISLLKGSFSVIKKTYEFECCVKGFTIEEKFCNFVFHLRCIMCGFLGKKGNSRRESL